MRWIWQNDDQDRKFIIDEKNPLLSPYLEISYQNEHEISVNPWLRFYDIFSPLMNCLRRDSSCASDEDFIQRKKNVINIIFHFLAKLDEWGRMHPFFLEEIIIEREILSGGWGNFPRRIYPSLSKAEKNSLLHFLRLHLVYQCRLSFLLPALHEFFPGSILYYYVPEREFILYIPVAPTEENRQKLHILLHFFFDITYSLKEENIFWEHHFGIIGVEDTMCIDEMVIY